LAFSFCPLSSAAALLLLCYICFADA